MPISRINEFVAAAGREAELEGRLRSLIGMIEGCDGCRSAEVLSSLDHPGTFVIYETWDSLDHHKNAARAIPQDMVADTVAMLSKPPRGEYFSSGP